MEIYFAKVTLRRPHRKAEKRVVAAKGGTWVSSMNPVSFFLYGHLPGGTSIDFTPVDNPTRRQRSVATKELEGNGSPEWVEIFQ